MIRLMIKTHTVTGLKYLCITSKENYEEYTGSGVYWQRHLKIHGKTYTTKVIFEHPQHDDTFRDVCLAVSEFLDVVNSKDFANLIHEDGNSGAYGHTFTNEQRERQRNGVKEFWQSERGMQLRKEMSIKQKEFWKNERGSQLRQEMSAKQKEFWESDRGENAKERIRHKIRGSWSSSKLEKMIQKIKDTWTEERRQEQSIRTKERMKYLKETGKLQEIVNKVNDTKSKWSKEKRAKVAAKRRKSILANQSHREYCNKMKKIRKGDGNPASRKFRYKDRIFTTGKEFHSFMKTLGYKRWQVMDMLNDKENTDVERLFEYNATLQAVCPHCGADSGVVTKLSTFKRWHFDNCKKRNT